MNGWLRMDSLPHVALAKLVPLLQVALRSLEWPHQSQSRLIISTVALVRGHAVVYGHGGVQCSRCGRSVRSKKQLAALRCPGRKPWILAVADRSHDLVVADPVAYCRRCGAFGSSRAPRLKQACPNVARGTQQDRLQRLLAGFHPATGLRLGPPGGLGAAAVAGGT